MAHGAIQASLPDLYHVIDALDAAGGSGDIFGPGPDLSVFYIAFKRDHAVLHFDLSADDVFRDIPRLDPRQNRQVARRHTRAFSGVVSAIRFNLYVIKYARYAFGVPGSSLGLLFIGLSRDDTGQCDHAATRIHVDVGGAGLIVHRQFAFHYGGDGGVGDAPPFAIRARQRE